MLKSNFLADELLFRPMKKMSLKSNNKKNGERRQNGCSGIWISLKVRGCISSPHNSRDCRGFDDADTKQSPGTGPGLW